MKHLDYKLAGKIAFISGGSHGIGFEITKLLGKYGCKVIYCSRNSDRLKKTKIIKLISCVIDTKKFCLITCSPVKPNLFFNKSPP